jgi:hypothetical protein
MLHVENNTGYEAPHYAIFSILLLLPLLLVKYLPSSFLSNIFSKVGIDNTGGKGNKNYVTMCYCTAVHNMLLYGCTQYVTVQLYKTCYCIAVHNMLLYSCTQYVTV